MRQQDDGVLSSPLSQGSDRGETPLFVGFSHLGNIVEQNWSPYGVCTHFLWHHVAEMMNEPQSGTITFGLRPFPMWFFFRFDFKFSANSERLRPILMQSERWIEMGDFRSKTKSWILTQ